MVSAAIRLRFCGFGMKCSVRMLCSRSASLTSSTRMSSDIASSSLRKFSACSVCEDCSSSLLSLVTPSTRRATSPPNSCESSSIVAPVSSTVSCSRPVAIEALSSFHADRMPATSTGWEK